MKLYVAFVSGRSGRTKVPGISDTAAEFATRLSRYIPFEILEFRSEDALLQGVRKIAGRSAPYLVLLDSQGKQIASEEWAGLIDSHLGQGTQSLVFAIGGADGWSSTARKDAQLVLSFGRMTLAHEIARVVLLEQLYRAFTILKGHPYHGGH